MCTISLVACSGEFQQNLLLDLNSHTRLRTGEIIVVTPVCHVLSPFIQPLLNECVVFRFVYIHTEVDFAIRSYIFTFKSISIQLSSIIFSLI